MLSAVLVRLAKFGSIAYRDGVIKRSSRKSLGPRYFVGFGHFLGKLPNFQKYPEPLQHNDSGCFPDSGLRMTLYDLLVRSASWELPFSYLGEKRALQAITKIFQIRLRPAAQISHCTMWDRYFRRWLPPIHIRRHRNIPAGQWMHTAYPRRNVQLCRYRLVPQLPAQ